MVRVAWLTDLHLNFLSAEDVAAFLHDLAGRKFSALLVGGDISEGHEVAAHLRELAAAVRVPVYFVLGNHDFYFSSIAAVRETVLRLVQAAPGLVWLSHSGAIELAPSVGLVGHDGWGDARLGDYERSLVEMNDHRLIGEFAGLDKQSRWPVLKALGDQAAAHVRRVLPEAAARFPEVLLLTHVPPFEGACWYQGQISDRHWLPHFTCQALGQAILEVMRQHRRTQLTVLCGHTHSAGRYQAAENVLVLTGGAEYGRPQIERTFEFAS
ncbi:MAG: metallophosphoesterase [Pirellulales bacterium]|nr:metallophosphoesterase [Pirellulales bacterium]